MLGLPKLKAFVTHKLNAIQNIEVVFHRIENIKGKEENAGYQHFLLFPLCFQKDCFFYSAAVKKCHYKCGKGLTPYHYQTTTF